MASYTQITTREATDILNLYGFLENDQIIKMTPLSLGISNSNYKIETQLKTLLLKISNDKSSDDLKDEQAILILLKEQNYPYSLKPHIDLKGNSVYQYQNYHGVIFPFIEGIPPGPNDFTCQEIGQALGKLHKLKFSKEKLSSIRNHEKVGFGAKEIKNYIEQSNCPEDFKLGVLNFFPDKLDSFLQENFARGIIHGDLYYDNTLFHMNKLHAVLDFEQAGLGEYILDLGISISGTCLEKGRIIRPLVDSFIKGYEIERKLPPNEIKNLDNAIILGLVSISLWRIKRFYEGNLNPAMRDSYQDLLNRARHFQDTLT